MSRRSKRLIRAASELLHDASTRTGNDEPTWLVSEECIHALSAAMVAYEDEL